MTWPDCEKCGRRIRLATGETREHATRFTDGALFCRPCRTRYLKRKQARLELRATRHAVRNYR